MQKKKISIVAGDMVGFSRLIEEDEINTLKRQKIIIKDIIDPKLGENNGKLIKTTGDGFLAVFENCDQSLSFSIEIQNQIIDQEKIIIPEKKYGTELELTTVKLFLIMTIFMEMK